MHPDAQQIEYQLACFDAALAKTIGSIDPGSQPIVHWHGTAVTVVSDCAYPPSRVSGILMSEHLAPALAAFPHHRAALALELAPIFHAASVQIALHDAGFSPIATDVIWLFDTRRHRVPHAPANLVWGGDWHMTDAIPHDQERLVRVAYQRLPGAVLVSLLHPDGIIASAGIVCQDGVGYCFGGWIAPHRRVKGVNQALLDARIHYAAAHDCHTVVLVAAPMHGMARTALGRGFLHGWGREQWTKPTPRNGRIR